MPSCGPSQSSKSTAQLAGQGRVERKMITHAISCKGTSTLEEKDEYKEAEYEPSGKEGSGAAEPRTSKSEAKAGDKIKSEANVKEFELNLHTKFNALESMIEAKVETKVEIMNKREAEDEENKAESNVGIAFSSLCKSNENQDWGQS